MADESQFNHKQILEWKRKFAEYGDAYGEAISEIVGPLHELLGHDDHALRLGALSAVAVDLAANICVMLSHSDEIGSDSLDADALTMEVRDIRSRLTDVIEEWQKAHGQTIVDLTLKNIQENN